MQTAYQMRGFWNRQTTIYFAYSNTDNTLIGYFNQPTKWKQYNPADFESFKRELETARLTNENVWLDYSAVEMIKKMPDGANWLTDNSTGKPHFKINDPAYQVSFVQVIP